MRLSDYLNSLGSTADEVADSLRRQGIKGIVKSSCHCPILNAIYKAIPDYWAGLRIVNGIQYGDHWSYYASLRDDQICDPTLPQPVMDFMGKFDHGEYPDLQANTVRVVRERIWE